MRPDTEISRNIANVLKWHVAVEDEKIRIKVENGIATLEGAVDWDFQRQAVEEAVRCLPGILRLDNFIGLKPRATSDNIRKAVLASLHNNPALDAEAILVEVAANKVTLRGSVHSLLEKEEAERTAWHNYGVVAVHNELFITAPEYIS